MKDRKTLVSLAVALACSGLAFFLLYRQAREIEGRSRPVPVLVAKQYLPANGPFRRDRVERRMLPEAFVSPGAVSDPASLEGLFARAPISAGEQILANKFSPAGSALTGSLEPGERAYCMDVTESQGVGGLLKPGDRVDLLARYDSAARRTTAFALQNIRVLATGRATAPSSQTSGEDGSYAHVTLALTPEQAEVLAFLEDRASLKLVLRAEGDRDLAVLPPVGESEVLSRLGRPTVFSRRIEVIRGTGSSNDGGME